MQSAPWKTGLISHNLCQLEYKFKNHPGKPWVVFLHGFAQNYEAFNDVYSALESNFSFLSLHIFFHGESDIDSDKPLESEDWKILIEKLFQTLQIQKAHWMGFSMGGKFTLLSLEKMPELFSEVTLLAPDGIVMNPWYKMATQSLPGRFCLWVFLKYMPFIRFLVLIFSKAGIIKSSLGRFTESQLSTPEKRELVLNVWIRFRKIWPAEKKWRENAKTNNIPIGIILGKYDSIISVKKFKAKRKELSEVHWVELNAGHSNLIERFAKTLVTNL